MPILRAHAIVQDRQLWKLLGR